MRIRGTVGSHKGSIASQMLILYLRFYALEQQKEGHSLSPGFIRRAGSQWAKAAQYLILTDLDQISVQNLMVKFSLVHFP